MSIDILEGATFFQISTFTVDGVKPKRCFFNCSKGTHLIRSPAQGEHTLACLWSSPAPNVSSENPRDVQHSQEEGAKGRVRRHAVKKCRGRLVGRVRAIHTGATSFQSRPPQKKSAATLSHHSAFHEILSLGRAEKGSLTVLPASTQPAEPS